MWHWNVWFPCLQKLSDLTHDLNSIRINSYIKPSLTIISYFCWKLINWNCFGSMCKLLAKVYIYSISQYYTRAPDILQISMQGGIEELLTFHSSSDRLLPCSHYSIINIFLPTSLNLSFKLCQVNENGNYRHKAVKTHHKFSVTRYCCT